jgi:hypothetical protein
MDRSEVIATESDVRRFRIDRLEERIAPSVAPGLLGYEGQPGNQGGGNGGGGGQPNGLLGYEGQPGNQGG